MVRARAFLGAEVGRILHRLELVPFVPLVERIQINQEKAASRIGQSVVGLQRDGGLERLRDTVFALTGRAFTIGRLRPVHS